MINLNFLEAFKKNGIPLSPTQDVTKYIMEENELLKQKSELIAQIMAGSNLQCGIFLLVDETKTLRKYYFCKGSSHACNSMKKPVWGTNNYTSDSDLCLAARHSGVFDSKGGICLIEETAGLKNYVGTLKNGVKTLDYGDYSKTIVSLFSCKNSQNLKT